MSYDAFLYEWYLKTGSLDVGDRSARGVGATEIGVGATVIGAICGVVGLTGKKQKSGEMEIEILNYTPYSLAPYNVSTKDFGFCQVPRIMASGETSTVKGSRDSEFVNGSSNVTLRLFIGNSSSKCIQVAIEIKLTSEGRWQIRNYSIGSNALDKYFLAEEDGEKLQYVCYHAHDASMPSFSFNLQPIRYSSGGKVKLLFLPTVNEKPYWWY
ncbi:hypothetical protein [Moorena sp. SIO3B2]|uniref:hypothetical protein n=1 Tax=Moorena sp. SIO3B2 TaxID=2607827 RepID=UPI0013C68284|nr:hypothetical protein [Moorena sp. SIO3B2]NEP36140.1 hypothetical protein [Moorena sp. SIO3B2]